MHLTSLVGAFIAAELYQDVNCHFYPSMANLVIPWFFVGLCEHLDLTAICAIIWGIYIFLAFLYLVIWIHKHVR